MHLWAITCKKDPIVVKAFNTRKSARRVLKAFVVPEHYCIVKFV